MPASTAPAAKAAIIALLEARPNLSGVTVSWGSPTEEDDVRREHIWLGDVTTDGEWRVLGGNWRDEDYTIEMTVRVMRLGDDEQSTEERAWALLDEVSGALASDKWLGGLLEGPAVAIREARQTNTPQPSQWSARITAQIACHARFTP